MSLRQTLDEIDIEKLEIVHIGDENIRLRSEPVEDHEEARAIADVLSRKLDLLKGAGLAAPQAGIMRRVFVMQVRKTELFPDREETPLFVIINPEVTYYDEGFLEEWEGCFSIPGYAGKVPRHSKLHLTWTDYEGVAHAQDFEGYIARVIQHEFDHLEGRLYVDHMPNMKCFATTDNYVRRRKAGTLPQ